MIPSGRSSETTSRTWQRWERAEFPVPLIVLRYLEALP